METQDARASLLLCRATQHTLLRLLTTTSVLGAYGLPPLTNEQAWAVWRKLGEDDRIAMAEEPGGLEAGWEALASRATASPKLWMDAYLAAFAQVGGHQLVTLDQAYRQFEGLDVVIITSGS